MTEQKCRSTAWLVFIKMGASLSMLVLLILLSAAKRWSVDMAIFRGFVLVLAGLLNAVILFRLRLFLRDCYDFHKLDIVIPVLACADVVLEILNQFTEVALVQSPEDMAKIIASRILFIIVPWGVIIVVFAAVLLRLSFAERSLLRPYAYLNLAAGVILIASILVLASPIFSLMLFPLLALTGIGSDILLGLTFFRAGESEQLEFV